MAPLRIALVLAAVGLLAVGCAGRQVTVRSLTFASGGVAVPAYLVTPSGGGRHPAVVLVHGSGGDRSELLGPAKALARLGLVAMTITEPSTSHPPKAVSTVAALLAETKAGALADAAAVRRAADVLASRSDVDPRRLGYLGWSAGAKTGALVAAADARFRALALLSAGAQPVASFVAAAPPPYRAAVRKTLTAVDPLTAIAKARPGSILLEDGRRDEIVPRAALENMVRAAPRGTVVRWYSAPHALDAAAFRDAEHWLAGRLAK